MTDLEELRAEQLAAWNAQDADRVASLYTEDARYLDSQVPDGIVGRAALQKRLAGLFKLAPPMRYEADRIWEIEGGFCARCFCTIEASASDEQKVVQLLRRVDIALLRDGKISHNEVYTHPLTKDPRGS